MKPHLIPFKRCHFKKKINTNSTAVFVRLSLLSLSNDQSTLLLLVPTSRPRLPQLHILQPEWSVRHHLDGYAEAEVIPFVRFLGCRRQQNNRYMYMSVRHHYPDVATLTVYFKIPTTGKHFLCGL